MKEKKSDIVAKKAVENNDSRATSVWFAEAVDFYRLRIGMLHQFKVAVSRDFLTSFFRGSNP